MTTHSAAWLSRLHSDWLGRNHDRPRLTVVAGASGVGKSTLIHRMFSDDARLGPTITADDVPGLDDRTAYGRRDRLDAYHLNDADREALIFARQSFLTETTLSDVCCRRLRMLRRAKSMGYAVSLVFLYGYDTEQILIRRRRRHAVRDHQITLAQVRLQQQRGWQNLHCAARIADLSLALDAEALLGCRREAARMPLPLSDARPFLTRSPEAPR